MESHSRSGQKPASSDRGMPGLLDKALALVDKLPRWLRGRVRKFLLKPYAYSPTLFRTRRSDAFILSFPKCGRTWLRVLLCRYIIDLESLPAADLLDTFELTCSVPGLPVITFEHEDTSYNVSRVLAANLETNKRRYRSKKVVFLVRDPRDTMVSYYLHCLKRKKCYDGPISDFIRDPRYGAPVYLRYLQIWDANRATPGDLIVLRYEDLHRSTAAEFGRLLDFLGLPRRDDLIRSVVEFASFSNMRKMEEQNAFQSTRLTPKNASDADSFKVRKGQVGGYQAYLAPADLAYLEDLMRRECPSSFGYAAGPVARAA